MKNNFLIRLIFDLLLFFSIIKGWWFLAIPLIVIGFWFQTFYIEGLFAGIAYDALFGMTSNQGLWGYVGTINAVVIWILIKMLKKSMRR